MSVFINLAVGPPLYINTYNIKKFQLLAKVLTLLSDHKTNVHSRTATSVLLNQIQGEGEPFLFSEKCKPGCYVVK